MALSSSQKKLLKSLKTVAKEQGEDGKNLTGLIGELSVCDILDIKWEPSTGYDCIASRARKVEVKTRRDSKGGEVNKSGRMGRFGKGGKYEFDFGLYVELDAGFEVRNIYELNKKTLMTLEGKEKPGRGLHISSFVNNQNKVRKFPA